MAYTSESQGEELFLSRLADLAQRALRQDRPFTLGFLNDRQQALCRSRLPKGLYGRFFGGYPDAERCYYGISPFEEIPDSVFPIRCVEITFRKQDELGHRDFLGSILGLDLKRECVGDIIVTPGRALVYLSANIADLVLSELDKVGRVGVQCRDASGEVPDQPRSYEPVEGTVSSLRLDCLVAFLHRCSRKEAAELIGQKLVAVDGAARQGTYMVQPGDKISIRGQGKFLYEGQTGVSKRDKLWVQFQRYL